MTSNRPFNLAAQLVAAQLNNNAGAGRTGTATRAINQAVVLLGKYRFNGDMPATVGPAGVVRFHSSIL